MEDTMFEPTKVNGLNDELCISNLIECELNSEEIDKIISKIEIEENFTFFDQMEIIDL